ncbi:MAG TPA: glycosyltransferase family 39 protein [Thermoanaerobaculia bacterium]
MSIRERTLFVGGLTVLLILAALLRFYHLGVPAYDCDELYSLRIQGLSPKSIASVVGRSVFHDLHPPLSYLVYMVWIALFGTAEVAVRSLPLLLGLVSVALIGLIGRRIGGTWVGLAAAALMAFNPFHIAYSQEARSYALAVALTIASHFFLLRSLREASARNLTVYALLLVAAIYTHYFALLALLSHGFIASWALLTGDEGSRRAARSTLLTFGCAMATYIAWLPALVFQASGSPEGASLDYLASDSPLTRAGGFLRDVAGLGPSPYLLPTTAALLALLAFAFLCRERLPAAAESGPASVPPRWLGFLLLVAAVLIAVGVPLVAPVHLFPQARQVLLSEGYSPADIERELQGLMQFAISIPLALGAIGLVILGWRWLSSLLARLPRRGAGRPLAVNALLAGLLLVPLAVVLALALKGVPLLSDRNLLVCEAPLTLALGVGAAKLAQTRWGRLALVPLLLVLAVGRFQYQPISGVFGVAGKPLGMQTGAWRDLVRELDRRGGHDLPLVMVDAPRSDPAEFYLSDRPVKRIVESDPIARVRLPEEFRFVHLKGNRDSEALRSKMAGVASLQPRFQVDEFVIYDARSLPPRM